MRRVGENTELEKFLDRLITAGFVGVLLAFYLGMVISVVKGRYWLAALQVLGVTFSVLGLKQYLRYRQ